MPAKYLPVAAQIYTLRHLLGSEEGLAKAFGQIKEAGYDSVQYLPLPGFTPERVKKLCEDAGIFIPSSHCDCNALFANPDASAELHLSLGCKFVGIGGMPEEYRGSADGFRRFSDRANEVAERLSGYGLKLTYHNHWFEFEKVDGVSAYSVFEECFSEKMLFEVDTAWATYGGCDPAALIARLGHRCGAVHFKDLGYKPDGGWITLEVGRGTLDWQAIADSVKAADVGLVTVEQDECGGDPAESLAISRTAVKKLLGV